MSKNIHGSGVHVTLLDESSNKAVFVLFKDRDDHVFYDLGGSREKNESVQHNARREAFEESAGLIDITSLKKIRDLPYRDMLTPSKDYYRAHFLLLVPSVSRDEFYQDYKTNVANIHRSSLPEHWKETVDMAFFDFESFQKARPVGDRKKSYWVHDSHGKRRKVSRRAYKVCLEALRRLRKGHTHKGFDAHKTNLHKLQKKKGCPRHLKHMHLNTTGAKEIVVYQV